MGNEPFNTAKAGAAVAIAQSLKSVKEDELPRRLQRI
jgi:hypothetical protein